MASNATGNERAASAQAPVLEVDEDWEEWDRSDAFWIHATAGSAAGVVEHTAMFPLDTLKTLRQTSRRSTRERPQLKQLVRKHGLLRMWRGMPVTMSACIPAHAAYFSVYEYTKLVMGVDEPGHHPMGAALAGALATTLHDLVMTPLDVVKQRLQLGYYAGVFDCVKQMAVEEGPRAFFRSYPTTLAMNIPYAATMVATNETMKEFINPHGEHQMSTFLLSGATSGAVAAIVTTPLDVVKTRLQTQSLTVPTLGSTPDVRNFSTSTGGGGGPKVPHLKLGVANFYTSATPAYTGFVDAVQKIYRTEGTRGFFRGVRPRLMLHTPSLAISWGTYEYVKKLLKS